MDDGSALRLSVEVVTPAAMQAAVAAAKAKAKA